MSKYGKLIAIGATTLLAAAGTLSAGIFMSSARESSMAADGYVLSSDWQSTQSEKSGSDETAPESYYFSGGTKVRGKFPNELVFHDVEGTKRSVGKESFLHYADGSASALSDGVLVNLDDINTGLVNHYGVEKNTVIAVDSPLRTTGMRSPSTTLSGRSAMTALCSTQTARPYTCPPARR